MPCVESAPAARGLGGGGGGEAGAYIGWGVRAGGSNPDRGYGRVKSGLGKGPVKSGSGMRAGQIRNGKRVHHENKKIKGMLVFTSGFLLGF